jgi:flagellar hook-associated protein 2
MASTVSSTPDSATTGSQLATALGGGSGIDMTALATNLAQAEFGGRLSNIDQKSNKLDTSISQASQLKSDLLSLSTSLGSLIRTGSLAATPSVANGTVATATLPPGSSGTAGSYSLEVSQLASPQVLNSPAFGSAGAATGSGTLTINFGTISGSSFTADPSHAAVPITIAAGATLTDVANAINQAGAGVTAYIANAADGAHLVLKGQTGASQAFTLSASEIPGDPGLANLAWNPATGASSRLAATASDASFKLDGIARTASSNTIANVAPGLSLKLTGTNIGQPTTVSFSDPTSGISGAMSDLTTALNSLMSELKTDLDPASGALAQDPATRAARSQLLQLTSATIMPNAAAGDPKTLSDLGMSIDKNGNFTLDTARLTKALTDNPKGVAAMFTTGLYGVYGTVDSLTRDLTATGQPGSLGSAIDKYTKLKSTLADQRSALVTQQDQVRSRLIKQFASTNSLVATSKSTLSYLQNQIAAWNKP